MAEFNISLENDIVEYYGEKVVFGTIEIGDFKEVFHASLSYWDRGYYLYQWKIALERIFNGEASTAIVSCMYHPEKSNFLFWWPIYVVGDDVIFHNQSLNFNLCSPPFDESSMHKSIDDRVAELEEGEDRPSEWKTTMLALKEFYNRNLVDVELE
ncbi:MAG: hypothetical protein ACI935_002138 [Moritella dasanensis]|jgi:hypothetical protein